jgi:hypothetical protein
VEALQGQLDPVQENQGLGLATAIPARKVFWEAAPAAEVAAQVPRDQASLVLRRANAALIPPYIKY